MRTESGHHKQLRTGETGWIHKITDGTAPRGNSPTSPKKDKPYVDATAFMLPLWRSTTREMLEEQAKFLGVTPESLILTGWAWSQFHNAWAIPMRNGEGKIVGVRIRNNSGSKWTLTGTHTGVFTCQGSIQRTVILPEGPTDTAAAISLGYFAIGRPSCSGGIFDIARCVTKLRIGRAVIIGDADDEQEREHGRNPGVAGALTLAEHLPIPSIILIVPGVKDFREFYRNGGSRELLDCMISKQTWRMPKDKIL